MAESSKKWIALTGISILSFVVFIDFTIVNTILPGIQRDLTATVGQLQWVMNSFVLMLTVMMVTAGRLGDIFGRRRALYIGVIVFGAASFLAGASEDPQFLIFCRFLQGVAAAIILTCGTALACHHFPESEQGTALAVFMSITGVGMALGPVIGGLFMSTLSWRWAFYVNVPVIILGFLISWRTVDETPRQEEEKIDWLGLGLLTPGMAALVTAIMEGNDWGWGNPLTIGCFVVGIVCLAAFGVLERKTESPIIDFALLKNRGFLAAVAVALSLGAFIVVGTFMASLYLQTVRNEIPLVAGLMLLPISALVVIVPPMIGKLADKKGPIPFLIAGQICLALSALLQIFFEPASPAVFVLLGLGMFGLGWGLQQATSTLAASSSVPAAATGLAVGALWSIWNFGSSMGLAIAGLIFEELDRHTLNAALARENIKLSAADQDVVRSLLSDPSKAQETLGKLTPGLETKMLPIFQDAFMAGYSGAMWYLLVVCTLAAIAIPLIARGAEKET